MTNPYGNPAQPGQGQGGYPYQAQQQYPQQPYPPQYGQRRPSGATAIIAAVLGLVVGGMVGYFVVWVFTDVLSRVSIGDLPGELMTTFLLYAAAALLLIIGAVVTFFRLLAGAILLIIGAVTAFATTLIYPALVGGEYGQFLEAIFTFEGDAAISPVAGLVGAPIVLIMAVLPPTFRYLSRKPSAAAGYAQRPGFAPQPSYGPPPGYPPQGYGQQPGYGQQQGQRPQGW